MPNLRPDLARHLRQRLQAFTEGFRHNLALIGPPGSGKSHQLQLLLQDPPPNLLIVYCQLYHESCPSFLQRLISTILHAGVAAADSAAAAAVTLPDARQRAEQILPRTAAAASQAEAVVAKRAYGEAFTRALDLLPLLIEESRRPCALILDEFLCLEELGLVHAFRELGKRVMTWPSTLFILASSHPHGARMILRERLQLLFGQFELVELGGVDTDVAALWVQRELKGLRGAKTMAPFLISWLGAYPWYLNTFLKRLKERAVLGQQPDITESLFLQTAWDLIGASDGVLYQGCASRVEELAREHGGARAADALIQIAAGARTATQTAARIGRGSLSDALQLLVEHDLAQRNGTCWMLPDPVLRCWLSVLGVQRAGGHDHLDAVRERVERHVRAVWTRWAQAAQLTFSEQVVELFSRFCDDTVSLDAKVGRLPRFDRIVAHRPPAAGAEAYLVADGAGRRWCAAVHRGPVDETGIAEFDGFCRSQSPKPSRKVLIMQSRLEEHARLLAKAANMWVWEPHEVRLLRQLYGAP